MTNRLRHDGIVVIVDDDVAVREALCLLMTSAGLDARAFASAEAFLAAPLPDGPCCLLLDLRLPDIDGLEVQELLQQREAGLPIIFLTGYGDVTAAVQALKRGALNFFQKPDYDPVALVSSVQDALHTHAQALAHLEESRELQQRLELLTPREREIMTQIADGMANKVIAMECAISERTVEIHRSRVMKKLGVRSAAELVQLLAQER